MKTEDWISTELNELQAQGLRRTLIPYPRGGSRIISGGKELLNFSSNDYLGMSGRAEVIESAAGILMSAGAGSGASRLMTGTLDIHEQLEKELASFKHYPAALIFGSGYAANVGIIPALAGRNDRVFMDRLCHASIVDAAILSRAKIVRFNHNDPGHLDKVMAAEENKGRRLVVTESVFSMDGDLAPLSEIAATSGKHGAMLMVDEAHATGIFGPDGGGCVTGAGVEGLVNVSMGTLSKALGAAGGFAACSRSMRELLVNRARSFIYSTALPPVAAAAALASLRLIMRDTGIGRRLLSNADQFRKSLHDAGLDTGLSQSQIIPVMTGSNEAAIALSAGLRKKGIVAVPIRPPTVPHGTARVRFSITIDHTPEDLALAVDAIIATARKCDICW